MELIIFGVMGAKFSDKKNQQMSLRVDKRVVFKKHMGKRLLLLCYLLLELDAKWAIYSFIDLFSFVNMDMHLYLQHICKNHLHTRLSLVVMYSV